ncbi:MAG: AAA family ATPase [Butyricicoccaceae bacterium]
MSKFVIAIGREYGSGGLETAQKLSEVLGVPYYDRDLISLAAEKRGVSTDVIERADEVKAKPWDTPAVAGMPSFNDKVFSIQAEIIREKAETESCIIVGRCADQLLKHHDGCLSVFIHANPEFRIQRIMSEHKLPRDEAARLIKRHDKTRRAYYQYYTDATWGGRDSYDLILSSSKLGIDGVVAVILKALEATAP